MDRLKSDLLSIKAVNPVSKEQKIALKSTPHKTIWEFAFLLDYLLTLISQFWVALQTKHISKRQTSQVRPFRVVKRRTYRCSNKLRTLWISTKVSNKLRLKIKVQRVEHHKRELAIQNLMLFIEKVALSKRLVIRTSELLSRDHFLDLRCLSKSSMVISIMPALPNCPLDSTLINCILQLLAKISSTKTTPMRISINSINITLNEQYLIATCINLKLRNITWALPFRAWELASLRGLISCSQRFLTATKPLRC